jgi:hypothetical protein
MAVTAIIFFQGMAVTSYCEPVADLNNTGAGKVFLKQAAKSFERTR